MVWHVWHCVQAMAKTPASSLEPKSRDWVPLFVAYSSARGTHHLTDAQSASVYKPSPDSESDSDSDSDSEAGSEPEANQATAAAAAASVLEGDSKKKQMEEQQEGACEVHVGAKAWRGQLKEWLGFVGGLKAAKGIFRSDDLKQCVVRHLLDTDSGVQQAALRALQVEKLQLLLAVLLVPTKNSALCT